MNVNSALQHNINILLSYIDASNLVQTCFLLKKLKTISNNASVELAFEQYQSLLKTYNLNSAFKNKLDFNFVYYSFSDEFQYEELFYINRKTQASSIADKSVVYKYNKLFSNNTNSVFIPEAENFISGLKEIIDKHENCQFLLSTSTPLNLAIFETIFENYNNVNITNTNIYEYDFINQKFDLIFAIPTFGGKAINYNSKDFICREYDAIAFENLLLHINDSGTLGIILPARITFATGRTEKLRAFIQNMYKIDEISELPFGVIQNIGIKTYFFAISNGRTDDITIKKYCFDKTKTNLIVQDETFVMAQELELLGDWNINKIFATQGEEWQKYQNSGTKKVRLADTATIFRGKVVNRKDDNGNIGVINISNLKEYEIDYDNLDHLEEDIRKVNNYLLKEDDVLLSARGTTIKIAVYKEQSYPCIASSNLIVIRPAPNRLCGTYLKIFFDSDIGTKIIKSMQQGTTLVNISYKDLDNIEIPLLPFDEQTEISKTYNQELDIYNTAISKAREKWKNTINELESKF